MQKQPTYTKIWRHLMHSMVNYAGTTKTSSNLKQITRMIVLLSVTRVVMLSKDYRLRLSIIACKTRLDREVSFEDMNWAMKLIEHNKHARGIWERTVPARK